MARFGDVGPYSVGNVKIITASENCREANLGRKFSEATRLNMARAQLGRGRGRKLSEATKLKISLAMRK